MAAGPASAVQGFVSSVVETAMAPVEALNLAVAKATLGALDFLPKMPAARLFGDLVLQFGHTHPHPPTFGIPLPSIGPVLASGSWNVLINNLPAARNGDLGLSVWCGGYFPIFEIMTGSSHVFIGGARASRALMDPTLHCLPDPFGGKWGIGKLDVAMAVLGVGMSALSLAAASEAEVAAEDKASDLQGTADAEAAAASAAAAGVAAATAGAQLAADVAATAMGLLMGKDPGIGFPFGMIITGSPNVLIGGFPMPGWATILKGLGKLLKPIVRRIQMKLPPGRLRSALCPATGHPVEVVTGRMFTTKTDFRIDGRIPLVFERLYDTSAIDYESALGWGWTHPYDQHIWHSKKYNCLILRNEENRQVRFNLLSVGQKQFQPLERTWLERTGENEFELTDLINGLIYKFGKTDVDFADFKSEENALRLLQIVDRNENRLQMEYKDNLLQAIHDGSNDLISFAYYEFGGRNRLVEVFRHLKNGQTISVMKFGYDGDAQLISATNRTYVPYKYHYKDRLMTQETNRNGLSFYFEYEGEGQNARCVRTWGDGDIYERWITYLPKAKMTRVKDGLGGETVYHYSDLDLVTKVFNAEGGTSEFEYGESGELLNEVDELNRARSYSYDEQLNCTGVVQEDGTTRNIVFNEFSQPAVVVDETGAEWRREYDAKGNIVATTNPLDARREYEYNRFGDIVKFRDALGNETAFDWTGDGQIKSVTRPLGGRAIYTQNEAGLLEEITDETSGSRIRYSYDDAGRIKRVSETNSAKQTVGVQKYEYDDQDNLVLYVDALGHKTNYRYSGYDKLAERTDALGFRRQFKYDREERLTEIINERAENYLFEYDLLDRIIEETGFDGARATYKYNRAGEVVYQKDALKRETFFRRDALGRVTSRLRSDASTVDYVYDKRGRITEARNGQSEVKLNYDAAWRLVKEEQNGRVVEYEYDAEGRRVARNLLGDKQASSRVEYDYDADGNLLNIKLAGREIKYKRDQSGRLTSRQMPNGLEENFSYDINGRLSGQKVTVGAGGREIVRRGYEWDALGNVAQISDSLRGTRRYQYDAVERLNKVERILSGQTVKLPEEPRGSQKSKSVLPPEKRIWQADDRSGLEFGQVKETEDFEYDGAGNLLERNSNIKGARKFAYERGNKLKQKEKAEYVYDAVGNLIEKRQPSGERVKYEYDADNQLTAVATETGGRVEFQYDAFRRRTAKITERGATGFLWDGDVLLGEQKDTFQEYVYEGYAPLARIKDARIEIFHNDYLGTPKELTDQTGEIVWQGNYDEYGRVESVKGEAEQNIRFQGQYEDAETGLFYNRFRYYDADAERYVNQDPIGLKGGLNGYDYTPNPANSIDPLGLVPIPAFDDLKRMAESSLDFSTPRDGAVFWSGNNMQRAQDWATANGKSTVEMTPGGRYLNDLDLFGKGSPLTPQQAGEIWDIASNKFSNQASGDVNVFSTGAKKMNAWGNMRTWWRVELPNLLRNSRVTSITRRKHDGTKSKTGNRTC